METKDLGFSQYGKNSSLRDHLEAIQKHAEAASRANRTEFKPEIKFPSQISVEPEKPLTTGRTWPRIVTETEGQTFINNSSPKVDTKTWKGELPKYSMDYDTKLNYPIKTTEDDLDLDGHLTKIRNHAQTSLNILGGSSGVSKVLKSTSTTSEQSEPTNNWDWLIWLIIIGFFMFVFWGHHNSEQKTKHNQRLERDTSALVEFFS